MSIKKIALKVLVVLTGIILIQPSASLAQGICYTDCDCDTKVNLADLVTIKGEFLRNGCATNPCQADCDCDTKVNLADLVLMKGEFLRTDCPACVPEGKVCDYPVTSATTTTPASCGIEITYGRPGRRGIPLSCNDFIDFTICTDCTLYDPSCLVWTITPAASWLSIAPIDDVTWRLIIGSACQDPDKADSYAITATDTCNNASDTVTIEIL
jgi:hypothetical protein